MTKKRARILATIMALGLIAFVAYAAEHPTASFPWGNSITYNLYRIYIVVMVVLFIAPFRRDSGES